ncbi:MAG TPA: YihY/virulence factor BrkB family protein [Blastocatellia bacterium]|nr:YihY/virulence factor BrkB family protein [Blastocatellia bacterium]
MRFSIAKTVVAQRERVNRTAQKSACHIHSRRFFCYNNDVDSETQKPASKRSLPGTLMDECYKDDVFGHAAQLGFYFLFALFPMLIFLAALVGYLPIPHLLDRMIDYLSQVLPTTALILVQQTLQEITRRPRGGLLSFGLIATVWAASSGLHALINSLNVAYSVPQMRSWWRDRLLAIGLTFGFSFLIIVALALIFFGGNLGSWIADAFHLGPAFRTGWTLLQWPTVVLFVWFGLELIYFSAPNRRMKWRWLTPGAVFALLSWLMISYGFKWYVLRIANYTLTYGSLGSVMALMFWLYLTSIAILIGGEINGLLERRRSAN